MGWLKGEAGVDDDFHVAAAFAAFAAGLGVNGLLQDAAEEVVLFFGGLGCGVGAQDGADGGGDVGLGGVYALQLLDLCGDSFKLFADCRLLLGDGLTALEENFGGVNALLHELVGPLFLGGELGQFLFQPGEDGAKGGGGVGVVGGQLLGGVIVQFEGHRRQHDLPGSQGRPNSETVLGSGLTVAVHQLGKCYGDGLGAIPDEEQPKARFRSLAQTGNDYSQ